MSTFHVRLTHTFCIALVGTLLFACAQTRPKPLMKSNPDGSSTAYKRYERYPQRDFFNHWVRKAYSPARESDVELAQGDQAAVLTQWGKPDYIRKAFKSLDDEKVQEWVYIEKRRVFQFVRHELAFEGELTDHEQLLIRLGYPDSYSTTIGESGLEYVTLHYGNIFLPGRNDTYRLTDGWIVHSHEGN